MLLVEEQEGYLARKTTCFKTPRMRIMGGNWLTRIFAGNCPLNSACYGICYYDSVVPNLLLFARKSRVVSLI